MSEAYNPKVLGICCRWCSYAGADLAGAMRLQYSPAVKIMMVPCTGRVDILHILKAFEAGWDTVFVSGCHEGDCHYLAGNIQARKRVAQEMTDRAIRLGPSPVKRAEREAWEAAQPAAAAAS